jgi:hypothetical protein
MKKSALLLPPLLLTLACQHPELEAFRQKPAPLVVSFLMPTGIPTAREIQQDYAAALRARLATRVTVVPEGVAPPPGAVELEVLVRRMDIGRGASEPSAAAVGVATGVTVGLLSAAAGNRRGGDFFFDGLFWGLWAGAHAADAIRHEHRHLGYYPSRVQAQVTLKLGGSPDLRRNPVLYEFDVNGHEVIDAMDPLRRSDGEDPVRVREEEARAFARVVTWKLQEKFGWETHPMPSFYRAEPAPEPRPETQPSAKPAEGGS